MVTLNESKDKSDPPTWVWWHDATPDYVPAGYHISAGDFPSGWKYYVYHNSYEGSETEHLGNFDSLEDAVSSINSHIGQ